MALLSNTDETWPLATLSSTQLSKCCNDQNCFSQVFLSIWIPSVLLDLYSNACHVHIINTTLTKGSMQVQGNWEQTCFRFWSDPLVLLGVTAAVEMNVKLLTEINNQNIELLLDFFKLNLNLIYTF